MTDAPTAPCEDVVSPPPSELSRDSTFGSDGYASGHSERSTSIELTQEDATVGFLDTSNAEVLCDEKELFHALTACHFDTPPSFLSPSKPFEPDACPPVAGCSPDNPATLQSPYLAEQLSWPGYLLQQLKSFFLMTGFFESIERTMNASYEAYSNALANAAATLHDATAYTFSSYCHHNTTGETPPPEQTTSSSSSSSTTIPPPTDRCATVSSNFPPLSFNFSAFGAGGLSALLWMLWQSLESMLNEMRRLQDMVCTMKFTIGNLTDKLEQTTNNLTATQKELENIASSKDRLQRWADTVIWHIPEPIRLQLIYDQFFGTSEASNLSVPPPPPPPPPGLQPQQTFLDVPPPPPPPPRPPPYVQVPHLRKHRSLKVEKKMPSAAPANDQGSCEFQ